MTHGSLFEITQHIPKETRKISKFNNNNNKKHLMRLYYAFSYIFKPVMVSLRTAFSVQYTERFCCCKHWVVKLQYSLLNKLHRKLSYTQTHYEQQTVKTSKTELSH